MKIQSELAVSEDYS